MFFEPSLNAKNILNQQLGAATILLKQRNALAKAKNARMCSFITIYIVILSLNVLQATVLSSPSKPRCIIHLTTN